ncbi:MAG TPA: hypothetical protein VF665_24060 [Longimicrobium sp.]|jgi:hypothetical protein|uniref:hypothetical protein n=1 Tax=Longimicrobium sp. TaxID=2029185 RepID=UPI002ED86222
MSDPEWKTIDLRGASDEELIAFIFDHPRQLGDDPWYHGEAWEMTGLQTEPAAIVGFLTRLFGAPEPLLHRFSWLQIDTGIWAMFSAWPSEYFGEAVRGREVPWPAREACIDRLPVYYERMVAPALRAAEADGEGWFMLPDFLAHGYDGTGGRARRSRDNEDDRRMQDALHTAFQRMLASENHNVNAAALHGIFHLQHPAGFGRVRAWLDDRPALHPSVREYAERALERGHVL